MGAAGRVAPVKLLGAFLIGLLLGAGTVILVPRWRPGPGVTAAQDSARVARATADSAVALAGIAVDSLDAWRPIVAAALARPRRISVGVIAHTVVIAPIGAADTSRTVTVPPEVVDQLVQDDSTIHALREGWARSLAAVGRLEAAARADTLADRAAAYASLAALNDLEHQLDQARREARLWKWGGRVVLVVAGAVAVEKGVSALLR